MLKKKNINHERVFTVAKQSDASLLKDFRIKNFGEFKNRKRRASRFGVNTSKARKFNHFKFFAHQLIEPFNVLLLTMIIADMAIYFTLEKSFDHIVSAVVSGILLLITITIAHFQAFKTFKVNIETNNILVNQAWMLKYPIEDPDDIHIEKLQENFSELSWGLLTIGDVIYVKPGDIIPSDLKIIWSEKLVINDSYIRGEIKRVHKSNVYEPAEEVYDLQNMLLSQSVVVDGYGLGIVCNIKENNVASKFIKQNNKDTSSFYERGISKITKALMLSVLIIFPSVLFASHFSSLEKSTETWIHGALFAITVVIGLIPEGLPAIISFIQLYGRTKIMSENVIVKNFNSTQNLGAVDILISNKSGSITKDRPQISKWLNYDLEKDEYVYELAFLSAYFQNSTNLSLEQELLAREEYKDKVIEGYDLIDHKQFGFGKKVSSVLLQKEEYRIQITKGSPKELMGKITKYFKNGKVFELTDKELFKINHDLTEQSKQGFRIMIVTAKQSTSEEEINEEDLCYIGFICFEDIIQENAAEAIDVLAKYNVNYKMLSGDGVEVTRWAAESIGMNDIQLITGEDITNIDLKELKVIIKSINIFAQLSPLQKASIIYNYKQNKNVVAYLGDGEGDVVAIKKADVGITTMDSSPLAKQFADIIVKEKKLINIDNSIMIGRKTFVNTLKYVHTTIATNIGLLLAIIISTIIFPFLPMSSNQLLLQALVLDISNVGFIFDRVDDVSIQRPIRWSRKKIAWYTLMHALIPTVISLSNLFIASAGLGWFTKDIDGSLNDEKLQTAFYIESFLTHTLLMFCWRGEGLTFIKTFPNWRFTIINISAVILVAITVFVPGVNSVFGMVEPDAIWFLIMLALLISTYFIAETVKIIYKKIFKVWF